MKKVAQSIKNRLSLREPQSKSLEILEKIVDTIKLGNDESLNDSLQQLKDLFPTLSSFERNFPSICFSLATGVGKTRLMGAFITYLFLEKGIKNFFVVAPNLTIYNKLIDDLSKPTNPKYVFKGVAEFSTMPPRIITGDNYAEMSPRNTSLFEESININIFNISKINSEVRGGNLPKIKRLSEYLGDSYFNYFASLDDLVIIMDESHHYRADAGMNALNDLKPILGLELTATPIDTHGDKFKNVVFDYPLAKALQDGFVKEPAIATRRNFNPDQYKDNPLELDMLKLEDGIRLHEDTKVALDIYSRDTGNKLVKPFILVVTKDTEHASKIKEMIESNSFFEGRYSGKVMDIHSKQGGSEKEENIQKLLNLEDPSNKVEIVIHVNMLKEGWDVTNLYTIIPLRASRAQILTEQTIGRGLRLPYGKKTGVNKVDKLTIIAHDSFQAIIEEANKPNSIIKQENVIEIDPKELPDIQEVITATPTYYETFKQENTYGISENYNGSTLVLRDSQSSIIDILPELNKVTNNINNLSKPEIQKIALESIQKNLESNPQKNLFKEQILEEVARDYKEIVDSFIKNTIAIPRIVLVQSSKINSGFKIFDLDTTNLNYQPVSEEILVRNLQSNSNEVISSLGMGFIRDTESNILVNELMNYSEIDYDRDSELLYKLVDQAINKLKKDKSSNDLRNIILYHKKDIAKFIYTQMKAHFFTEHTDYEEPKVLPFRDIVKANYSKYTKDGIKDYRETITPTNLIPSYIFSGFKKSCLNYCKFDGKPEKDFASILESDSVVQKWLRPAPNQFQIYWNNNSQKYEPDFIVETNDFIYMVEIKAENNMDTPDVLQKTESAKKYCEIVTKYNLQNQGKEWKYSLIPHNQITFSTGVANLLDRFKA